MNDSKLAKTLNLEITESQAPNIADITVAYVDLANKMSEYTRLSTRELNRIITSIHQANQVV